VAVALKFGEEKSIRLARKYETTVEILQHYTEHQAHRRNKTNHGKPVRPIPCELCKKDVTGNHLMRSYKKRVHLSCRDAGENAVRKTAALFSGTDKEVKHAEALEPISV